MSMKVHGRDFSVRVSNFRCANALTVDSLWWVVACSIAWKHLAWCTVRVKAKELSSQDHSNRGHACMLCAVCVCVCVCVCVR